MKLRVNEDIDPANLVNSESKTSRSRSFLLFVFVAVLASIAVVGSLSVNNNNNNNRNQPKVAASIERIINGVKAEPGEYPYIVSLQDDFGHFCGGTLITKDIVLSAAHCAGGQYSALIGQQDIQTPDKNKKISVVEEIKHPGYNSAQTNNDYMILKLEKPYHEGEFAEVDKVFIGGGKPVSVAGWGNTKTIGSSFPNNLMHVDVETQTNQECANTYASYNQYSQGDITESMLCAWKRGKDSCQGDSGGPLVVLGNNGDSDRLVGIVSWGDDCAHDDLPGVYARVSRAYTWIEQKVCEISDYPDPFNCGGGGTDTGGGGTDTGGGGTDTGGGGGYGSTTKEDFNSDFGEWIQKHTTEGRTRWKAELAGATGVASIEEKSSISTTVDSSWLKVTARVYIDNLESDENFCLEYRSASGSQWKQAECWDENQLGNMVWKTISAIIASPASEIRFKCNANVKNDDVLFDEITYEK